MRGVHLSWRPSAGRDGWGRDRWAGQVQERLAGAGARRAAAPVRREREVGFDPASLRGRAWAGLPDAQQADRPAQASAAWRGPAPEQSRRRGEFPPTPAVSGRWAAAAEWEFWVPEDPAAARLRCHREMAAWVRTAPDQGAAQSAGVSPPAARDGWEVRKPEPEPWSDVQPAEAPLPAARPEDVPVYRLTVDVWVTRDAPPQLRQGPFHRQAGPESQRLRGPAPATFPH